jgi:hypothetical protein
MSYRLIHLALATVVTFTPAPQCHSQLGDQRQGKVESVSRLAPGDLDFLVGKWVGTLEYLDYKDDRTKQTIKASLDCSAKDDGVAYRFSYVEPNGKALTGDSVKLTIAATGTSLLVNDEPWTVAATSIDKNERLWKVTFDRNGMENGKLAKLRRTLILNSDILTIRTEVQRDEGDKSLVRNEYVLKKQ